MTADKLNDPVEPKVSSDVVAQVARCRNVIAHYRDKTNFERGDFSLDDIEELIAATLRASDPSRELVERVKPDICLEVANELRRTSAHHEATSKGAAIYAATLLERLAALAQGQSR